jgi:cell division initiation protein
MLDPQDIRKHEFTRAWRGYNRDEVHALLDALAREFEETTRRNQLVAAELRAVKEEAARYQKSEKTLQDAALAMQAAVEEKRRAAEEGADALLRETRERIAGETSAAKARIEGLRAELQTLENERARFYLRFQNLLNEQSALLESLMDVAPAAPEEDPPA